MTDDYMTRLVRDLRLKYGGDDHYLAAEEFERETKRVVQEQAALVCIPTPQAVALLMTIHEMLDAIKFYRERQR